PGDISKWGDFSTDPLMRSRAAQLLNRCGGLERDLRAGRAGEPWLSRGTPSGPNPPHLPRASQCLADRIAAVDDHLCAGISCGPEGPSRTSQPMSSIRSRMLSASLKLRP